MSRCVPQNSLCLTPPAASADHFIGRPSNFIQVPKTLFRLLVGLISIAFDGLETCPNCRDRKVLPEAGQIIHIHERPAVHSVDVERPMQMIDFVLQDSRVPTGSLDYSRLSRFIQILDFHRASPRHNGGEPFHAETAFEEFH